MHPFAALERRDVGRAVGLAGDVDAVVAIGPAVVPLGSLLARIGVIIGVDTIRVGDAGRAEVSVIDRGDVERAGPEPVLAERQRPVGMRLAHSDRALPFREHRLGTGPLDIAAVDYDLGPPGVAYADRIDADYHTDTGKERTEWNDGRTYRNDGVDIAREPDGTPYVTAFERSGWGEYDRSTRPRPVRGATMKKRGRRARDIVDHIERRSAGGRWLSGRWRMEGGLGNASLAVTAGTVRLKAIRFP